MFNRGISTYPALSSSLTSTVIHSPTSSFLLHVFCSCLHLSPSLAIPLSAHLPCPTVLTPRVSSSKVRPTARLERAVCVWHRWVWHSYREQGQGRGSDAAADLRQVPCHSLQHLQVVPDQLWLFWKNHHWEADRVSGTRGDGSCPVCRNVIFCYVSFATLVLSWVGCGSDTAWLWYKRARLHTITIQLRNMGLL